MTGEFELYKDEAGRYRFRFRVGEKTLLHSRAYKSKYNCTVGIAAARNCSPDADSFVIERTTGGQYRFKLVAPNHRVLGVSRTSGHRGHRGVLTSQETDEIALVQQLAANARLNDRTLRTQRVERIRALEAQKNNWRYRIYAAPRDCRGVYRPRDNSVLIVQGFKTECARNNYWKRWIHPVTADSAGARYEYVMCDYPQDGQWRFISERRYSNVKLISSNV